MAIGCHTSDSEATRALGAAVAGLVERGDLIVLVGDLGTGKTVFVQGFAAALGVTARVTSPSFTLANRYRGGLIVNHLDVYRFERITEVRDLALSELLEEGVTLVEWGRTIAGALPAEQLEVTIAFDPAGFDTRRLTITWCGDAWLRRRSSLEQALAPWSC